MCSGRVPKFGGDTNKRNTIKDYVHHMLHEHKLFLDVVPPQVTDQKDTPEPAHEKDHTLEPANDEQDHTSKPFHDDQDNTPVPSNGQQYCTSEHTHNHPCVGETSSHDVQHDQPNFKIFRGIHESPCYDIDIEESVISITSCT